ncbi:MAG TPA: hypothetical protein VM938_02025 [Acidimicrobiales bacterium]|nr:hypothetical protein [Acidimicrobiales bacterium]
MAQRLIAVFADKQAAQAAAEAVRAGGATDVQVGGRADNRTALQAEMREEMEHTSAGAGSVGPFTKEMTKGLLVGTMIGGLIGGLLGIPAAFVAFGDVNLATRLVITIGVGLAAGSTLGFVMGGGLGAKGPAEQLAAERGVTLSVTTDDPEMAEVLRRHDPIRVDVVQGDQPVATVTSEDDEGGVQEVRGTLVQSEGDWSSVREQHGR